jgi:hypothetical protein
VHFLIDEDAPRSAAELLAAHGHDIVYAVDVVLQGSADELLAKWAHEQQAIIVTCNYRHFDALLGRQAFAQAGLIGIPQLDARSRLERCLGLIECECRQGRVWIEVRPRTVFINHPAPPQPEGD